MEGRATPDIGQVAKLMGEPARAAMLAALLGGRALPAGELARLAAALEALARSGRPGPSIRPRTFHEA